MGDPNRRPSRARRALSLALDVVLFAIALVVLRKVLTQYDLSDVLGAVGEIGPAYLLAALVITALGYTALVGYDYLSLRLVERPVPLKQMWLPSFISWAVSQSAPVSILTGGGVRVRLFAGIGLTPAETAAVAAVNVVTYVLGLFTVAGLAFLFAPVRIPPGLHLPLANLRPVGVLFLLVVAGVLVAGWRGVGTLRLWKWKLELPPVGFLVRQLVVSSADWILSSGALYALLRAAGPVPYLHFLTTFLFAQIVTQVVPLPGGIGVFEAVVLLLRPSAATATAMTAALLLYRVLYYLIPLLVAASLLGVLQHQQGKRVLPAPVRRLSRTLAPHVFAVLTFVGGLFLLLTGTIPESPHRLAGLAHLLPLVVIEGSHFLGSIVGVALVLLAWGLERRLRGAWRFTVALMGLGVPLMLLRGLDYVSAAVLAVLLLLLLPSRRAFYRRSPLTTEPLGTGWTAATLLALGALVWLGFFVNRHVEYAGDLWWQFALDKDAPRTLRAGVGVAVTLVVWVVARLVQRARARRGHSGRP